ncbi:MAG: VanZ family protein [Bryobacterales bacterium]|nr:VanZ family protein [Bryobacterales bacterium]
MPLGLVWIAQLGIAAYFSLLPAVRLAGMPGSDKLWHLGGYLALALPIPFIWGSRRRVLAVGLLLALYGVGLEFAQEYVPGRSFELSDMFANSAGVVCGIALAVWLRSAILSRRWSLVPGSPSLR